MLPTGSGGEGSLGLGTPRGVGRFCETNRETTRRLASPPILELPRFPQPLSPASHLPLSQEETTVLKVRCRLRNAPPPHHPPSLRCLCVCVGDVITSALFSRGKGADCPSNCFRTMISEGTY